MEQLQAHNSPIVHGFQAFYYELLRQKEISLSKFFAAENSSPDPVVDSDTTELTQGSSEVEELIVAVQRKLTTVLENVSNVMSSQTRLNNQKLNEVKYAMTVLVDEIFINMRWDGAKFWRFNLLEKQLFQSEIAGEKFFSILDAALDDTRSINEDIAFVYLMCLSLGFKGKYRGNEHGDEYISWYKDKLYALLHKKPSRLFYPGRAHMISECYEYTITEDNKQSIPDTHFWAMVIMGVVFVYITVSYFVWFGITDEISEVLQAIAEQVRKGPLV